MADDNSGKKKLPRDTAHLIEIEDKAAKIAETIKKIRQEMTAAGMPTVELATGTIFHWLTLAEGLAAEYKGKFDSQKVKFEAAKLREQINSDRASGIRKKK